MAVTCQLCLLRILGLAIPVADSDFNSGRLFRGSSDSQFGSQGINGVNQANGTNGTKGTSDVTRSKTLVVAIRLHKPWVTRCL